jgi:hypothetical protein
MKYNLDDVMDMTGATNEQDFINAFQGKTEQEIKELLVYMFPGEPIEPEFIQEIKIYADRL